MQARYQLRYSPAAAHNPKNVLSVTAFSLAGKGLWMKPCVFLAFFAYCFHKPVSSLLFIRVSRYFYGENDQVSAHD